VIVHAYEHGARMREAINGMFAFAIWTSAGANSFSRGPPWISHFITSPSRQAVIRSEIKSLMQDPACPREMDSDSLAELFTFRYVPFTEDRCFSKASSNYRGLLDACAAGRVEIKRFWTWTPQVRSSGGKAN